MTDRSPITWSSLLVVNALLFASTSACSPPTTMKNRGPGELEMRELICGPQCVKRVLEYYGRPADLAEIVREIQYPDVTKGTSFRDLAQALEKRGVHVCAASAVGDSPIHWPHPVVLHFELEHRPTGHFAVLLPAGGTNQVALWSSTGGETLFPADICFARRTSIVLLTSPDPISSGQVRSLTGGGLPLLAVAAVLPVCASSVVAILLYRMKTRPARRSTGRE